MSHGFAGKKYNRYVNEYVWQAETILVIFLYLLPYLQSVQTVVLCRFWLQCSQSVRPRCHWDRLFCNYEQTNCWKCTSSSFRGKSGCQTYFRMSPCLNKYWIRLLRKDLAGFLFHFTCCRGARCWWRSWLRHCATGRKVAGSIPDGLIGILYWRNPSGPTMALELTHSLNEMSTRNISCG